MSLHRRRALTARLALASIALSAVLTGCGKGDMEENFRLWSNNEAGWEEMANYVADRGNDLKLRARALEILVDEGGQPSQVMRVAQKAQDKTEVLLALVPPLEKMLSNPNVKKQGHAKRVLFDMLGTGGLPEDKKDGVRKTISKWAFGDLSVDDPPQRITEKLGQRVRPEEIESLGNDGVHGAEIMLSKGIGRNEVIAFLQGLKTPEARQALIGGMRRYHKIKNVKVTEGDLAAIQATESVEGYAYFIELYLGRRDSTHGDDKIASSQAIAAAIQWGEKPENAKQIKEQFDKIRPLVDQLLAGKNCDDRWYGVQLLVQNTGAEGLKEALAKLPDDALYGQGEYAQNDVKMMITDLCAKDVKPLPADSVRPVLEAAYKSQRLIERIVAVRCLMTLGDDVSLGLLKAFDKKDPMGAKSVQPIVVVPTALTLADLAAAAAENIEYQRSVDKLAAEGKIDAETAKWRKNYAGYSFERRGKALQAFAEERATEKVASTKEKAAAK